MEKEIVLSPDETLEYIKKNVNVHDTIELSYNRVYAPGEVLGVDMENNFGEDELMISVHLSGDLVCDVVSVNLHKIKDDLLEVRHITDEQDLTVVVEDN